MTECHCPTQILFTAMNPQLHPMLRLGIYSETVGSQGNLIFPQSNKTSADQLEILFTSKFFTSLREEKLGTHSVWKGLPLQNGLSSVATGEVRNER